MSLLVVGTGDTDPMGRRLPPAAALCVGRSAATTRLRRKRVQRASYAASPSKLPAALSGGGKAGSAAAGGGCYVNGNGELMVEVGSSKKDGGGGRRVMVLADGRAEAAGALQWALSQAVRSNDTVVLLAVAKPVAPQNGRSSVSLVCPSLSAINLLVISFLTLSRISLTITFFVDYDVSAAVSESCVKMLGTKSQQHLAALRTVCESTRPEVRTLANAT